MLGVKRLLTDDPLTDCKNESTPDHNVWVADVSDARCEMKYEASEVSQVSVPRADRQTDTSNYIEKGLVAEISNLT